MVPNRLPSFWCGGRAVAPSGCRLSVPRTVRALGSHPLAATGCGGCEWRWFRRRLIDCKCGDGFCPDSAEGVPALWRPIVSFFTPGRGGRSRSRFHLGSFSVCLQSILAEPHRSAKRKTDPAHKRRTSRQPQLAALQATTPQSGSVIQSSLNTRALTLPQLRPPLA